jgi:hypothetical protein
MPSPSTPQTTSGTGHNPPRSKEEIEQIIVLQRLALCNRGLPCGPKALRTTLAKELPHAHLPSERAIARILDRNDLTHGRTGRYPGDPPERRKWLKPAVSAVNRLVPYAPLPYSTLKGIPSNSVSGNIRTVAPTVRDGKRLREGVRGNAAF